MAVKSVDFESSGDNLGAFNGDEWKSKQESMLEGVVNLSNTVDTDRETSWAPGKSLSFPSLSATVVRRHTYRVI